MLWYLWMWPYLKKKKNDEVIRVNPHPLWPYDLCIYAQSCLGPYKKGKFCTYTQTHTLGEFRVKRHRKISIYKNEWPWLPEASRRAFISSFHIGFKEFGYNSKYLNIISKVTNILFFSCYLMIGSINRHTVIRECANVMLYKIKYYNFIKPTSLQNTFIFYLFITVYIGVKKHCWT